MKRFVYFTNCGLFSAFAVSLACSPTLAQENVSSWTSVVSLRCFPAKNEPQIGHVTYKFITTVKEKVATVKAVIEPIDDMSFVPARLVVDPVIVRPVTDKPDKGERSFGWTEHVDFEGTDFGFIGLAFQNKANDELWLLNISKGPQGRKAGREDVNFECQTIDYTRTPEEQPQ